MTQEPDSPKELPNGRTAQPTGNLFADLQRERAEAEREEAEATARGDVQKAEHLRGVKNGLEYAMMKLNASDWGPGEFDAFPDERFMLRIGLSVNRRTGDLLITSGGEWEDDEEFENAYDLICDAARDLISRNPEDFVSDPVPRTVRLRHKSIPAVDTWGDPLMLSESEAASAKFIYDNGQFVFMTLLEGPTVRVERADVEVAPIEP